MKTLVLKDVNNKLSAYAPANEHSIVRKTLRRYVDKCHHHEYNEMKPAYVAIRAVGSSITKIFDVRFPLAQCRNFSDKLKC